MNQLIGCCGLDCEKCDARVATVTNDNALREKTAALRTKLNGVTITPEMINCTGIILIDSGLLWGLGTVLAALAAYATPMALFSGFASDCRTQ